MHAEIDIKQRRNFDFNHISISKDNKVFRLCHENNGNIQIFVEIANEIIASMRYIFLC
jgi:hypothetical protein